MAAVARGAATAGVVLLMLAALALIRAGVIAWCAASRHADRLADPAPLPGDDTGYEVADAEWDAARDRLAAEAACCPDPDTGYDISDAEFDAARAHLLAAYGRIPPPLQRVIDAGGRFKRAGDFAAGGDFDQWENEVRP